MAPTLQQPELMGGARYGARRDGALRSLPLAWRLLLNKHQ